MIIEALTAIKNLYDAGGAVGAALRAANTGGQWLNEAKDDVTPPYITVSWIASSTEHEMGSEAYEIATIQFDVFSEADDGGTEALDIADKLMALYNNATLTITDHNHLAMLRNGTGAAIFIDDVWQITITYSLWFD